jgi:hypothetical protein
MRRDYQAAPVGGDEDDSKDVCSGCFVHPEKEIIMGMRISSNLSPAAATQSSSVANWQQSQQTFKTLLSDIQSGDLSGAQQSYSALVGNNSPSPNSPLAKIGQALQNGDLAGAQQAAQALQASRGGHHHHHGGGSSAVSDSSQSPSTSSSSASDTSGPGSLFNFSA